MKTYDIDFAKKTCVNCKYARTGVDDEEESEVWFYCVRNKCGIESRGMTCKGFKLREDNGN